MRAVVTDATGNVGTAVVRALAARTEVPRPSSSDALLELLTAMAAGEGVPTPPLQADSLAGRLSEVRTGTGSRSR